MQKRLLPLLSLLLVIWGCGEAGFQSDVSKGIEIDPINVSFSVPALLVNQTINVAALPQSQQDELTTSEQTDLIEISTDDFDDYISDAEKFTVNEITYRIDGFPTGSRADLELSISVTLEGSQATFDLIDTTIEDVQTKTTDVQLYPGTGVNASGIAQLETALKDRSGFYLNIEVRVAGSDVVLTSEDVDFDIIFGFDVTARLQLD